MLTKRFWILIESFSLYASHIFTLPLVLEKVFPPVMGIFDFRLPPVHVGAEKGILLLHHISGNHKFPWHSCNFNIIFENEVSIFSLPYADSILEECQFLNEYPNPSGDGNPCSEEGQFWSFFERNTFQSQSFQNCGPTALHKVHLSLRGAKFYRIYLFLCNFCWIM